MTRAAGERCNEAAEAAARKGRLLRLIRVAIPQWKSGVGSRDALHRYWPRGRAA
jgi:hypothetical protein